MGPEGIKKLVEQQFEFGKRTIAKGMIPILEPEVDINAADKAKIEDLLVKELMAGLEKLPIESKVIFKLTLPEKPNLYAPLMGYPQVVRVVALSGGYDLAESNKRTIAKGMIPILEPEVDITAADKGKIEELLLPELMAGLDKLSPDQKVIFKLSLPEKPNLYAPLMG